MAISKNQADRLDAIYAILPKMECKGLCQECCGPILMTRLEWKRIKSANKGKPTPIKKDLRCPLLKDGRCSVYGVRPLICRLWGCKPERMLTDEEVADIFKAIEEAGK